MTAIVDASFAKVLADPVLITYFNGVEPAGSTDFTKDAAKTQALKDRVKKRKTVFVYLILYFIEFSNFSLLHSLVHHQCLAALIRNFLRPPTASLISRPLISSWRYVNIDCLLIKTKKINYFFLFSYWSGWLCKVQRSRHCGSRWFGCHGSWSSRNVNHNMIRCCCYWNILLFF